MTTTPTVREKFEKWKEEEYTYGNDAIQDLYSFFDFLEKELAEAEARGEARGVQKGREEMKKKCLNYFTNGQCGNMEELYDSIQSL